MIYIPAVNQDNTTIKKNILTTCSTTNMFCMWPEQHVSITNSSISIFSFITKVFYKFGVTKLKPGRAYPEEDCDTG